MIHPLHNQPQELLERMDLGEDEGRTDCAMGDGAALANPFVERVAGFVLG